MNIRLIRQLRWTGSAITLDRVSSVAVIVASAIVIWATLARSAGTAGAGREAEPLPAEPISIEGAPVKGAVDAQVVLIDYSDFECPYCARFARETLPALEDAYVRPGKVMLVFRHLPLETQHSNALHAAEAAECARLQGKFWEFHDVLFQNQPRLVKSDMADYARALALDTVAFSSCMDGRVTDKVRADALAAQKAGARSTPTFFIGRRDGDGLVRVVDRISGAQPLERFREKIDAVLAEE